MKDYMLLSIENKMKMIREKRKLKGGIALSDLLFAMIGIMFIMAIAYMKWPQVRDFLRTGSEWMELQSLQQAATNYTSLTLDGSAPTTAKDLVDGITADKAIDGIEHKGFMSDKSKRWASGNYNDVWGNPYTFADDGNGNHSITSNGPDGVAGNDDDMTVWY